MNVVALFGNGESGKTTVLKLFLAAVLEKYGKAARIVEASAENITPELLRRQIDLFERAKARGEDYEEHDVYAALEIDGRKVGITTKGDSEWDLRAELERFSDCDLIFCAARSKGETLAHLKKVTAKGSLILHNQHRVLAYGKVNDVDRRRVRANISMVRSLLEEL